MEIREEEEEEYVKEWEVQDEIEGMEYKGLSNRDRPVGLCECRRRRGE